MRDLILKRTPKDFDIITSAELKEVTSSLKVFFFFFFLQSMTMSVNGCLLSDTGLT